MKQSLFGPGKPLLRFFGSLKLAMLLLAIIIIATIVGTIVESRLDTSVAQAYVYDAPWFMAWLFLLCINLIASVWVRYPWKPHQIGFVITHAGIVVILVGAIVGRIWGFEGNLVLHKGQEPIGYIVTPKQALHAKTAAMKEPKAAELDLINRPPVPARPLQMKLGKVEVTAMDFAAELGLRTKIEKAETGKPAIRLIMTSGMSPKPIEQWLLLDDAHGQWQMGPTVIRYATQSDEGKSAPAFNHEQNVLREVHFAFAKMPEMNVIRPAEGKGTGAKASYRFSESDSGKGTLTISLGEIVADYPVAEILGREVQIANTDLKLRAAEYFADFRMQGKTPASVSERPNNPAVIFEIIGPATSVTASSGGCSHHASNESCSMPAEECDHGNQHDQNEHAGHQHQPSAGSELLISPKGDGTFQFIAKTKDKETVKGTTKPGEAFEPGLADWRCRIEETIDTAVTRHELAPLSDAAPRSVGTAGLLIRVTQGSDVDSRWVRMGEAAQFKVGGEAVEVAFGYKMQPLGFTVQLDKFEVEMNEGTQNPASFKSYVRFHDSEKGLTLARAVWMNNPANFPDFAAAGLLGTSYKFSQSSWNPQNLNETTLQVIRDPGWSFKWIGSLMLCAGLMTMFYLKPYPQFARAKTRSAPALPPRASLPVATANEIFAGK